MDEISREYMPDVIGNNALRTRLSLDIIHGHLPHAFIIEGTHGSGKKLIAKDIAASLVCENRQSTHKPLPCRECLACRKVFSNLSPDIITVSCGDKASIGVDESRFIREDVHIIPNDFEYKIYIIAEADKMTVQAQNALLLTLEEPPSYAVFILLCESSAELLETIKSRAPIFRTELMPSCEIEKYLLAKQKDGTLPPNLDAPQIKSISVSANGSIGRALEYLDDKKFAPIKEAREIALEFLSLIAENASAADAITMLSRFSQKKRDTLQFQLEVLLSASTDLLIIKKCEARTPIFFDNKELAIELCEKISLSHLFTICSAVSAAIEENKQNANTRLLIMKMANNAEIF